MELSGFQSKIATFPRRRQKDTAKTWDEASSWSPGELALQRELLFSFHSELHFDQAGLTCPP